MIRHIYSLFLLMVSLCPPSAQAQDFVDGPQLELHSPTHATLTFELSRKALAYVHVANNASFNNARLVQPAYTSETGTTFSFELSGLSPESHYHIDVQLNGRSKRKLPFSTVSYADHYDQAKTNGSKIITFEIQESDNETLLTNEAAEVLAHNAKTIKSIPEENSASPASVASSKPVESSEPLASAQSNTPEIITEADNDLDHETQPAKESDRAAAKDISDEPEEQTSVQMPFGTDDAEGDEGDEGDRDTRSDSKPAPPEKELKPNASDNVLGELPDFKPPINAKDYGLVIQPTLGHRLIKIYMSKREQLSPQSEVVIFDNRGVDRQRTAQVLRENGIQGIDLRNFDRGRYFVRLEALDGTAIWGAFELH